MSAVDEVSVPSGSRVARLLRGALCVAIAIWLLAPLLLLVPLSFTGAQSFRFPPTSWSTRWYSNLLSDPVWRDAITTTLIVGIAVAILSTVVGTLAAMAMQRSRWRITRAGWLLVFAPQVLPLVIVGAGIYYLFLVWNLTGTVTGLVLAQTALASANVVVIVTASLRAVDTNLERAGSSLGARPATVFRTVVIPQIRPAVSVAFVFAFLTSFGEAVLSLYISSPTLKTLPVQMFESSQTTTDPTIAAASALNIGIVVVGMLIVASVQAMRSRRANRQSNREGAQVLR